MKIAMVSILEGRGENRVVPYLKEHYDFKEGPIEIFPGMVEFEVVGGYLAQIRMPGKSTRSGAPYVLKPRTDVLDFSSPLHREDIVFYPGKVEGWRKTLHFIGEEDKLSELLKKLAVDLKNHFCPEDFNRDLGSAVKHWYPDFEVDPK